MGQRETSNEDRSPDCERASADPKQLVEFALDGIGPVREISPQSFPQFPRGLSLYRSFGEMDQDRDGAVGCQLASPSDDELLYFLIEITLPERKGIQSVKQRTTLSTRSSIRS
jgi:hypothetical protein